MRWGHAAAASAVAVLVLGACGDDAQNDGEGAEAPGVTFADEVTVPTDASGAVDVDPDGAEGSGEPDASDDADSPVDLDIEDLPDGWPDDFPLPDDGMIIFGAATTEGAARTLSVDMGVVDRSVDEVFDDLVDAITDRDFVILESSAATASTPATVTFETTEYVGDILVADGDTGTQLVATATVPL